MDEMFINDDRVTINLSHEEALGALMLSIARGLRRRRARVQPGLPGECPRCLAPLEIALRRELGSEPGADDWKEVYIYHCNRCGLTEQGVGGWPKNSGLSLSDFLFGPYADLGEEEAGSWDAQRRAREAEPRLDYDAWGSHRRSRRGPSSGCRQGPRPGEAGRAHRELRRHDRARGRGHQDRFRHFGRRRL